MPSFNSPPPLPFTASRLEGRVVFVTGASSGIGRAAVKRFAAEGAVVVAAARRFDALSQVVDEVRADGGEAMAVTCDVTDEDSVRRAIGTAVDRFGRLDGAFNNAGILGARRRLHELETDTFDQLLATNLRGPFLCMKHQIPAMLASGGGSIVHTSSVGGLVGSAKNGDYVASKWGLAGLVKSAALDYARKNIRVNAIAPGPTRSEAFDALVPDDDARGRMADYYPMNFVADADDMARAALFLLSEESRWTTGVILPCDGGFSAQ